MAKRLSAAALALGLLAAIAVASDVAPIAAAQSPLPACDPSVAPAVRFVGLPSRVVSGKEEVFSFEANSAAVLTPSGPYEAKMVDATGKTFFRGTLSDLGEELFITFAPEDRLARVSLTYREVVPNSALQCQRTISKTVRNRRLVLFPSRCSGGLKQRPRSIVVACGDANLQLRRMHWRRWGRRTTPGRGFAFLNDCVPFCAAGHFHDIRVRVRLYRRRRCSNIERYTYTRLKYQLVPKPSFVRDGTARVRFPCRLYDTTE